MENKKTVCELAGENAANAFTVFEQKLAFMTGLCGVKTQDDLISYIACKGEPADESCVGHPVLGVYYGSYRPDIFREEVILEKIEKGEAPNKYCCKSRCGHISWLKVVQKKPGYDYSRKAE